MRLTYMRRKAQAGFCLIVILLTWGAVGLSYVLGDCSPVFIGTQLDSTPSVNAYVCPQTVLTGYPVTVSVDAPRMAWPLVVRWDFDDRTEPKSMHASSRCTISTVHVYSTTGIYNVMCRVTDARSTTVTTYVPVYAGVEICRGSGAELAVEPVSPSRGFRLNIYIHGRFLGRWRLKIVRADGRQAVYLGSPAEWTPFAPPMPCGTWNSAWRGATTNSFHIDWTPTTERVTRTRGQDAIPQTGEAILEYQDPFGKIEAPVSCIVCTKVHYRRRAR